MSRYSNGNRWRKARARLRARGEPCAICGKPIDYSLPDTHPLGFSADHIRTIAQGGDRYAIENLQAAHLICNMRKGDGRRGKPRSYPDDVDVETSQDY